MASNLDNVLAGILALAAERFTAADALPGLVFLAPGRTVAWDNCCDDDTGGGQLYLRVIRVYPSSSFPRVDDIGACGAGMVAAQLAIGTVRCAHSIDSEGEAPTAEEMTGDLLNELDDMVLLYEALSKTEDVPGVIRAALGTWQPTGVQGGCAGGEWTFTIALSGLCWVPDPV